MVDLTFLTKEQVFGDDRLEIFDKYDARSAITDFGVLAGGKASKKEYYRECTGYDDYCNASYATSYYFLKTPTSGMVRIVGDHGEEAWCCANSHIAGSRPAFDYSVISSLQLNSRINVFGIKEIEYGEYPQWVVDNEEAKFLEDAYQKNNIRTTGKKYKSTELVNPKLDYHTEYIYNGDKYIRYVATTQINRGNMVSNGEIILSHRVFWIAVKPIVWLVDEKANIALSKYVLFSGIPIDYVDNYDGDFRKTYIKKFMDKYISKDMFSNESELIEAVDIKLIDDKKNDIDSIFEEALLKMNEISKDNPKTKILK